MTYNLNKDGFKTLQKKLKITTCFFLTLKTTDALESSPGAKSRAPESSGCAGAERGGQGSHTHQVAVEAGTARAPRFQTTHHTSPWSHLCGTRWRLVHSRTWAGTTLPPSTQPLVQSVVAVTSYSNRTPLVSPLDSKLLEGGDS